MRCAMSRMRVRGTDWRNSPKGGRSVGGDVRRVQGGGEDEDTETSSQVEEKCIRDNTVCK